MKITSHELKKLYEKIAEEIHHRKLDTISFENDYYWAVSLDDRENLSKDPQLTVGSLRDDIEGLKDILSEDRVLSVVDINRFANILIVIGQKMFPSPLDQPLDT